MASTTQPLTSTTTLKAAGKPDIKISGSTEVIDAIAQNNPFPDSPADVTIGTMSAAASADGSFPLPGVSNAPVVFHASASAYAGIAAYQTASKLASDLGFQDGDGEQLKIGFPQNANGRYMVVRWGFDASGQASGKMALDPAVNVTFGASGAAEGLFAFVNLVDKTKHAGDAASSLLGAWCTPGAVAANSHALQAGCWIVTEVTGQLKGSVGVQAGYDFSWVKSAGLNNLEGDIGLRIALGLQATLSAQLAGKYYLVLSRESATSGVRLRLFRAKTKGWGFALHTGGDIALSTGSLTPANLDDFIKAVLGIHDAQLLKFLGARNLTDIENAMGAAFLQKLRADGDAGKAFADLGSLLKRWNDLPNSVTSVIWKAASKVADLGAIQNAAKQISQMSEDSIHAQLDSWLHDASFYRNPICQWLEAAAAKDLFSLYESSQLQPLKQSAASLLSLLDGSSVEDTLTRLKGVVDNALNLAVLEAAIKNNNLAGIAAWVQQQLGGFLGVDSSQLNANLAKIDAAMQTIRGKAGDIYAATVKALNRKYAFSLDYAYTSSSTQSALIDVQFTDAAGAQLASAIRGDFSQILADPIAGVRLNQGTLTHAIERHSHVETHLPWWKGAADDLAKGYATASFVDGKDGRMQFYEAGASDVHALEVNTNLKRYASCCIGISGSVSGVRKYNVAAVDFGYSFVTSKAAMTGAELTYDFGAAADSYFPNVFTADGADHAKFKAWVTEWVKAANANQAAAGAGVIGNMWVNLQVRCRTQAGQDWVSALLNNTQKPDYWAMSRAMQTQIRKWLLAAYASNPSRFKNIPGKNPISAFLVYTALPALNDYAFDQQRQTLTTKPGGALVWDVRDPELATAITSTFAPAPLASNLNDIYNLLVGIPDLKGSAPYYQNSAKSIVGYVLNGLTTSDVYITWLQNEKAVIDGAKDAFEKLRTAGGRELENSLPVFSSSLVGLVTKFNRALADLSLDAPQVMRLFSPLVFQPAVAAMFPAIPAPASDALFDVALLQGAALPGADQPASNQVRIEQRITSFA
jgi:hypothetical protein